VQPYDRAAAAADWADARRVNSGSEGREARRPGGGRAGGAAANVWEGWRGEAVEVEMEGRLRVAG
jgi:hypothetical protein